MKHLAVLILCLGLAACSKKKKEETPPPPTPASGSTMAGSGSATGSGSDMAAGSGSAMAGSGSAAAGSGSDSGSGSAAGSASGSGSGSSAGAGSGSAEEKTAFEKMTAEEKADFMKKKVVPPMKAAFQKFDAKEYANFGCKTCHGKDPKKTKYKMPNPELPKLDFDALKAGKDKKAAEFMATVVKPEMAKILEEKEMDPAHPELGGFGCLECHEMKKK